MTITISLEEVHKFESDVRDWGIKRAQHLLQLGQTALQGRSLSFHSDVDIRPAIAKWEAEHPMPRLIPSV